MMLIHYIHKINSIVQRAKLTKISHLKVSMIVELVAILHV
jgi:hypothetical protein